MRLYLHSAAMFRRKRGATLLTTSVRYHQKDHDSVRRGSRNLYPPATPGSVGPPLRTLDASSWGPETASRGPGTVDLKAGNRDDWRWGWGSQGSLAGRRARLRSYRPPVRLDILPSDPSLATAEEDYILQRQGRC